MSESAVSGGRYWNFSEDIKPSKRRINGWVYTFLIMTPFFVALTLIFTGVVMFTPVDVVYPESIAGGWVNPTYSGGGGKIIGGLLLGLTMFALIGGILISRFCRASASLTVIVMALFGPAIFIGVFALGANVLRPIAINSNLSDSHPTFKEWAKNTYGYEVKSSIEKKGDYEVLQVANSSGADLTVKLFRDGENAYLYEDTFQLNDILTKINAEKQAKKAEAK